jgi:hypothetical protein
MLLCEWLLAWTFNKLLGGLLSVLFECIDIINFQHLHTRAVDMPCKRCLVFVDLTSTPDYWIGAQFCFACGWPQLAAGFRASVDFYA